MTRDDRRSPARPGENLPRIARQTVPGAEALGYYLFRPRAARANAPLLVTVHGISRNAREHVRAFAPEAEARGAAILAPLFDKTNFRGFQRLWPSSPDDGLSSERALRAMLDDARDRMGMASARIHLFGHSGGAQFAHRFAMAHPDRVARYAVSAAGWYTMPDLARAYPYGMKPGRRTLGARFDIDAYLRIPACAYVGERDTVRDRALNTAAAIDAHQGTSRLERAESWIAAMTTAARWRGLATPFALHVIPGSGHDFTDMARAGLAEAAMRCLYD